MAVSQYNALIQSAAAQYGLSPSLVSAVIQAESAGNPIAVSSAGAQGLMQLMPGTAAQYGVSNAFDPAANIDAGAHYLSDLITQYGDVSTALAAYNWGPGNVNSGRAIPASVQGYVDNVLSQAGGAAQWLGSSGGTAPLVDLSGAAATQPTADILSQLSTQLQLPDLSSVGISSNAELALLGLGAAALLWVVSK